MEDEFREYFSIGIVAQMLDVHPQTLRHYERRGLVVPTRTDGNTRLYSRKDVETIRMILRLANELGVNLAGIEVVLNMRSKLEELESERNSLIREIFQALFEELHSSNKDVKNALIKVQSGFLTKP
ncbi:MAG: helix-turn-helix transcriptional regulator [Candidatus Coatesbacteria bacterium]|nr:helix-turn-helix transcriptional regulator [Candidatus Coatesbacteria bacterium]